jgi:hypothetical protein
LLVFQVFAFELTSLKLLAETRRAH